MELCLIHNQIEGSGGDSMRFLITRGGEGRGGAALYKVEKLHIAFTAAFELILSVPKLNLPT